jgi:hypothetical protein
MHAANIAKTGIDRQLVGAVRADGIQELATFQAEVGGVSILSLTAGTDNHAVLSSARIGNAKSKSTIVFTHNILCFESRYSHWMRANSTGKSKQVNADYLLSQTGI